MKRRIHWSVYTIAALLAIGILDGLLRNPGTFIIPIIIFGGVFVLWKYPPNRWRKQPRQARSNPSPSGRAKSARDKRKPIPFKVIQGNKKDEKDSDPPYPYH